MSIFDHVSGEAAVLMTDAVTWNDFSSSNLRITKCLKVLPFVSAENSSNDALKIADALTYLQASAVRVV